jgi:hypothetical protein
MIWHDAQLAEMQRLVDAGERPAHVAAGLGGVDVVVVVAAEPVAVDVFAHFLFFFVAF